MIRRDALRYRAATVDRKLNVPLALLSGPPKGGEEIACDS